MGLSKAYISRFINGRDMNGKLQPHCSVMKSNIRNVAATSLLKGPNKCELVEQTE